MSSQPNRSLIDGIRCLQYLVSIGRAIGCRELAREMGENPTRINRFLMTMASVGLTVQDEQRRYLPGPNIQILAAQAIRGSPLFSTLLPRLDALAPKDVQVALGVLWENRVVYIYHSKPGALAYQALANSPLWPVHESVIGAVLLAGESDDAIRKLCTPHPVDAFLPHVAMAREQGSVVWRHDDKEISMALPLPMGNTRVGLALAGMYSLSETQIAARLQQLKELAKAVI